MGPRAPRDTPRDTGDHGPKRSRSPQGKRHAMTPGDATRGPLGTHGSPFRPFALRWGRGSLYALGMKGGMPDRHQEARNPDRSLRRSRAPPPAARRVVFHEGVDRLAGPIGIICRGFPAPVKGGPHRADAHPRHSRAGRASATGSAPHQPPPGNRRCIQLVPPPSSQSHQPVCRQRDGTPQTRGQGDPQQTSNPNRGVGGRNPETPRPRAGRDSTSPGQGQRPPDQPGQCATGLPTLAVTQSNR